MLLFGTSTQVHKYTNTQVHKCTSTQVHKYTSTQVHKYTSAQVHKYTSARLAATEIVNPFILRTSIFKYKVIHIYGREEYGGRGGIAPLSTLPLDGGEWSATNPEKKPQVPIE